jgi:GT2 family glycosyltransferase
MDSTAESMNTPMRPMVSVVVPVRNRLRELIHLVRLLDQQTLTRECWELIVGDDGSSDGLLDALGDRDDLRIISGPPENAYAARNRAAEQARADILAFTDADCRPDPQWLEEGLKALLESDVVGGQINWIAPPDRSIWSLLEIDTFVDQEAAVRLGVGLTGNLFVRRAVFERVGGFDESLPSHGDYDFVQRCVASGARLKHSPNAVVWHPTFDSARSLLRKLLQANWTYAVREARAGRRPYGLAPRSWVPIASTLRARRRSGRSLGLNRKRLEESGVQATWVEKTLAIPFIYLIFPYLGSAAQLWGRRLGRRGQIKPRQGPDAER